VNKKSSYESYGIVFSVVGHFALGSLLFAMEAKGPRSFPPPTVYSVSIEAGQSLGGIAQIPDKKGKQDLAPPKSVRPPPPLPVSDKEIKVSEKPVVTPPQPEEKIKVAALKAEPEKKPTPKATPVPTPRAASAKATPQPSTIEQPAKSAAEREKEELARINRQLEQAVQRYRGESTDAGGTGFGAGSLGGSGMGGGVQRPPEYFTYATILERQVKSGWRWAESRQDLIAQVSFEIFPNGVIGAINLVRSSGNPRFDDSVVRAIRVASPVPPPPDSVYQYFRHVRMTFDPMD
jgi:TonB family protein